MMTFSDVDRKTIQEWSEDEIFFHSPDSKNALDYLHNRGITNDIIKKFNIGYVPKETGHNLSGRIIMPLFDQHNKLVCLTTRDFSKEAYLPHWHESFDKTKYLYGLNVSKNDIFRLNKVIVVEGQFDTHVMHKHGLSITVAALGGAFSIDHVCLLRRYCTDFYLWFDPDDAGNKASERAMDMYEELNLSLFGINFIPIFINENLDPDQFVEKYGKSKVIEIMKKSKEEITRKKQAC